MKKMLPAQQHQLALANRYGSVVEAFTPSEPSKILLGIKDSPSIKAQWVTALAPLCRLHTKDASAHGGRVVDTAMANPLTGRCMTGSSSGTAVNVLLGINHLGLGTDGGGSAIYPAMAVNIYRDSVLGFSSPYFREQQRLSGKRLGKVLNMVEASAFTMPDGEAGSGFLIIAKKGQADFDSARALFESAQEARTQVFLDYFGS